MTFSRTACLTSAIALFAFPAFADVTAAGIWSDWKDLLTSYGATVTTDSETVSAGVVTVTGLKMAGKTPDGDFGAALDELRLAEQGDGTVVITMSDTLPFSVDVKGADGKSGTVSFMMQQPGLKMTASGDASHIRYDYDAPTLAIGQVMITGDEVPKDLSMNIDATFSGFSGFSDIMTGGERSYTTSSKIEKSSLAMDFTDPKSQKGQFQMRIDAQDLASSGTGQIGHMDMGMSAAEMIQGGMRSAGTISYGQTHSVLSVDGPDGTFQADSATEGGDLTVSLGEDGISYGGSNKHSTTTISSTNVPLPPLTFEVDESAGLIAIPLVPSDKEQTARILFKLVGLKIDDMLWAMIDQAGVLPHDPATLVVDLSAGVVLTEDFTSPAFAEHPDTPPGQIDTATLNTLQLSLAGADLTGDAAFTFDNSGPTPVPAGTLNLLLKGGNALLDKLVQMGLVPEDQATGARMMLGLFATPGEGDDTLVSKIEVMPDGSILANGQRIK